MKSISIRYLSGNDVATPALSDHEILAAIVSSLRVQGEGDTVIEARKHRIADKASGRHFNVLRGYIAPTSNAGIKVVGDFPDNYRPGRPTSRLFSSISATRPLRLYRQSSRKALA
ncbi:MAG: hypothetical protein OEO19_08330 [Gammaproteobacteria bacterium]|nr:hypothetical protein [Gammaproteobacteria bacterium]MDH3447400.1 hypothetical protein [Gammaproteobacteria bacterium]